MVPRVSFADRRERHYGLSHHSLTVINEIALVEFFLALPELKEPVKKQRLFEQAKAFPSRVKIHYLAEEKLETYLKEQTENLSTMGRSYAEDREFFLTAAAGGVLAAERCGEKNG